MDPIDWIYVALGTCFGLVMIYMFSYNIRMRRRENELRASRGSATDKEAMIARATRQKQQSQSHTLN
jgi:hypothetical protein